MPRNTTAIAIFAFPDAMIIFLLLLIRRLFDVAAAAVAAFSELLIMIFTLMPLMPLFARVPCLCFDAVDATAPCYYATSSEYARRLRRMLRADIDIVGTCYFAAAR